MMRTMSTLLGILATGTIPTLCLRYRHGSRVDPSPAPPADFVQSMQNLFLMFAGLMLVALIHTWLGRKAHRSEEEIQPVAQSRSGTVRASRHPVICQPGNGATCGRAYQGLCGA